MSNTNANDDHDATPTAKRHRTDASVSERPCVDAVMRCFERAERGGAACSIAAETSQPAEAAAAATVDLAGDASDDEITATCEREAFVPPGVMTLQSASPSVLRLLSEEGGNESCSQEGGDESSNEETLSLPVVPSVEVDPYNKLNGTVFLKWFLERYDWE